VLAATLVFSRAAKSEGMTALLTSPVLLLLLLQLADLSRLRLGGAVEAHVGMAVQVEESLQQIQHLGHLRHSTAQHNTAAALHIP
jgi:hypothetical protein